jgi:photosystem II stability/assembly factor-like uncharacterized protein
MKKIVILISFIFTMIGHSQNFWEKTPLPNPSDHFTTYTSLVIDSSNYIYSEGLSIMGSPPFVRSEDNGNSWSILIPNGLLDDSYMGSLLVDYNGYLLAANSKSGVIISTDHGNNWNSYNNDLTIETPNCMAIDNKGVLYVGTLDSGIYRSINKSNWVKVFNPPSFGPRNLVINSSGHIFAGTWNGVFRSTDSGDNWMSINNGLLNLDIQSLIIAQNGDIIVGDGSGYVSLSTDNGNTWTEIGATGTQIMSLAVNSLGYFFVGTYAGGVYFSSDNGNSWQQKNSGLFPYAYALAINSNGIIFLGGADGIYRGNSIMGINDKGLSVNSFYLQQNYPNPFNPSTTIKYSLANRQFVSLKVFNILGHEIVNLVNEEKAAGQYNVSFNAVNLPSGIYFYTIHAGNFTETKKLILLK